MGLLRTSQACLPGRQVNSAWTATCLDLQFNSYINNLTGNKCSTSGSAPPIIYNYFGLPAFGFSKVDRSRRYSYLRVCNSKVTSANRGLRQDYSAIRPNLSLLVGLCRSCRLTGKSPSKSCNLGQAILSQR